MEYEIVITVVDERVAGLVKDNIENKLNYHCDIRPKIINFEMGNKVNLTFCDDDVIYTIDDIMLDKHHNKIYHLNGVQGWKASANLMVVE